MKTALYLIFAVLMALLPLQANAKPIEIKSENFVMIGDIYDKNGKALLLELEQYRQAVLQLLGVTNAAPEIIPVRIYTAKNDRELKLLTGRTDIGGIYTTTLEGPVFILSSKSGFRRGKQARHIALHEYTHHLLSTYSNNVYPRWFNEGLANYFSTFEVDKKGQIIIGRPYQPYGYPLGQSTWMPTNVVVNSITHYPFKSTGKSTRGLNSASYFYAQSWLAVHYIQSVEGEPKKLAKYIKLINGQRDTSYVFKEAFGRTPEEFHKILKVYHKKNRFKTLTIKPETEIREHTFTVRIMSKGEAAFHKAEAMRAFEGQRVEVQMIKDQYAKAAEELGQTAVILSALADLAQRENDETQAQIYINKALALTPKDRTVLRTAGMLIAKKNDKAGSVKSAELKKARKYLIKALVQNPDDIMAHYFYAMTYKRSSEKPSAQAIASAATALDYYRSRNFVDTNLALASVLIDSNKYKLAIPALDKALIWSQNAGARMQAKAIKNYIKTKNSQEK